MVVEGKPGDIDFASALEDARRNVVAAAIVPHDNVGLKSVVETLVSAVQEKKRERKANVSAKNLINYKTQSNSPTSVHLLLTKFSWRLRVINIFPQSINTNIHRNLTIM